MQKLQKKTGGTQTTKYLWSKLISQNCGVIVENDFKRILHILKYIRVYLRALIIKKMCGTYSKTIFKIKFKVDFIRDH